MSVKIKVISPEKIIWDTEAEQIVLPAITGGLGILTNHAPLVSVLQTGILKKFDQQTWTPMVLLGGIAQIEDNQIIVLANGVEELTDATMTRDEANKQVLDLTEKCAALDPSNTVEQKNLTLELERAKARFEGLTLLGRK
jgi:F-type H+-transporting ATPase subunit epsilon